MTARSPIRSALLTICIAVVLLGGGGAIVLISTNRVSFNSSGLPNAWEPSSSSGSTWATSWAAINNTVTSAVSSVSAWNGSAWNTVTALTAPNGRSTGDVNLEWDGTRNRFVFCALDLGAATLNIWYGFSNDPSGTSWTFRSTAVFAATSFVGWDYPSIGVDNSGAL